MAVRHERVVLDLDDNFTAPFARATAAAEVFDRTINHMGGTSRDADRELSRLGGPGGSIDRVGTSSGRAGPEIDRLSGRLGIVRDVAITLGPALIPLGAAGVAGAAGLTAELGATAGALGVTILAVHGLGDGLKALNAYQLDPTQENLTKLRQVLDDLGPSGANFVRFIDQITPRLQTLQMAARNGLLPGLQEGIDDALTQLPKARSIIREISTELGDLASEGGESLQSGRLEDFFQYLKTDAAPTLADVVHTVGNLADGIANLVVAGKPLSRDFSAGLLEDSKAFDRWAISVDKTQGYEDFVAYVEKTGPQALDTLGALANTLLQIVEAAAPLGGPVLKGLEVIANVIGDIADSDLGTPIFTGLAALSLYNRALAVTAALSKNAALSQIGIAPTVSGNIQAQVNGIKALPGAFREATAAQEALTAAETEYQLASRKYVAQLQIQNRLTAEGYAMSELAQGRVADSLGRVELANYGVQQATDRVRAAEETRTATLRRTGIEAGKTAGLVGGLALATSGLAESTGYNHTLTLGLLGTMAGPYGAALGATVGLVMDLHDAEGKASEAVDHFNAAMMASEGNFGAQAQHIAELQKNVTDFQDKYDAGTWDSFIHSLTSVQGIDNAFRDDLGLDTYDKKLTKVVMDAEIKSAGIQEAVARIAHASGDMAVPSTRSFNTSFTTEAPTTLNAIDAAASRLKPTLDALGISFDDLGKMSPRQLSKTIGQIKDYNAQAASAAGQNKALAGAFADLDNEMLSTADSATAAGQALDNLLDPKLNLSAATDAWTSSLKTLNKDLDKNNKTIVGNSKAALQNRSVIRDRVSALKDVLDAQAANGASTGKLTRSIQEHRQALINDAKQAGISGQAMKAYLDKLGLTPKLVKTLIEANTDDARRKLGDLQALLANLHDKTVKVTVSELRVGAGGQANGLGIGADGNMVPKDNLPYADRYYYKLAPGEQIISNRYGQADRFRADTAAGRIPGYADGGTVARAGAGGTPKSFPAVHLQGPEPVMLETNLHDANVELAALGGGLKALRAEAALLKDELTKAKKAAANAEQALDNLKSTEASYEQSVSSAFTHDAFGNGLAGLNAQTSADTNDAQSMLAVLKDLVKHGLDPTSALFRDLAASGDLTTAQQLDALTRSQLASEQGAYGTRGAATGQLAAFAGTAAYGDAIKSQEKATQHLEHAAHELSQHLHGVEQAIKHLANLPDKVKQGAHDGTKSGSAEGTAAGQTTRQQRMAAAIRSGTGTGR